MLHQGAAVVVVGAVIGKGLCVGGVRIPSVSDIFVSADFLEPP